MNFNIPYAETDEQGRIISWGDLSPHTFLHQINPNYVFAPGLISPDLQYIDNGVIKERPSMDIRRDGWQFFGLPQPCEVWINNQHYEVEDGALEINLPQPGLYQVRLSAWPYRDVELKLEVTG